MASDGGVTITTSVENTDAAQRIVAICRHYLGDRLQDLVVHLLANGVLYLEIQTQDGIRIEYRSKPGENPRPVVERICAKMKEMSL